MSTEEALHLRAAARCELCTAAADLSVYEVPPQSDGSPERAVLTCATCRTQLENPDRADPNHWRCLNDAMWSEVPAVQVVAYRMLHRLRAEGWPAKLLEMLYLSEETRTWAEAGPPEDDAPVHTDGNGNVLQTGDSVVLTKDLKVKGANFTAKRGTAVRNIRLVRDHVGQVEGRVAGQLIVILTEYVKKMSR